jgi:hypothetical protein
MDETNMNAILDREILTIFFKNYVLNFLNLVFDCLKQKNHREMNFTFEQFIAYKLI